MLAGFSLVTGRVKATNKVDGYGGRGDDCGGPEVDPEFETGD